MNIRICTLALAATLTFAQAAVAEDKMAAPMEGDAMATDNMMATDAMAMDADQMLADCLAKAEAEMDAMKKDEASKACHDAHNMAGDAMAGDAMAGDAMAGDAMGGDAMGDDAMAPKQ
jgi:pentapeptide MXKDX repeat protein